MAFFPWKQNGYFIQPFGWLHVPALPEALRYSLKIVKKTENSSFLFIPLDENVFIGFNRV